MSARTSPRPSLANQGQSTGCPVLLHNAIDASEYADFTFQHDLNYAKEVKEYRAKAEDEPLAVLLSAWTYVGGGPAVAGATPGWSQVQMEPGFAWDPEAGGRATATCPGSAAGPSQVEVVIKPAKAEKAATANS